MTEETQKNIEATEEKTTITLRGCLTATKTLRDTMAQAKSPWFKVRRGQLLKFKSHYQDKRPGQFILVTRASGNHEVFVCEEGHGKYEKYSGSAQNFDAASEEEIMRHFGEGAKDESEKSGETVTPNTDEELGSLDVDDESGKLAGPGGSETETASNPDDNGQGSGESSSEKGPGADGESGVQAGDSGSNGSETGESSESVASEVGQDATAENGNSDQVAEGEKPIEGNDSTSPETQ